MPLPSGIMQPNRGVPRTRSHHQTGGRRRRLWCRVTIWLGLALSAYQVLWSFWLAGVNIPDVEVDAATGRKRIRRRPHLLRKRDKKTNKDVPTSPFDGIMESYFTLATINVPSTGLISDGDKKYSGVKATFCHIAWNLQDKDPTSVPTFQALRDESPLCLGTRFSVDLWDITRKAESYDWRNHTFAATKPRAGQGPHKPTAVLFHQTRCGSTLISNILSAFMPQHTRVYSEAPAPMAALQACEGNRRCDAGAQDALIRDVFYMMGRSPGPTLPQYVFYKFHATHLLPIFTRAMPQTPWIFAYRDPVEIMMSHFKNYQQGNPKGNPLGRNFMPHCLRNYGTNQQPAVLKEVVASTDGRSIDLLSQEEYCAAHLAALGEVAIREHNRQQPAAAAASDSDNGFKGWFVNYNELPHKIWEVILPGLVPFVSHDQVMHMHDVSKLYSRGEKAGEHWLEDSTLKQGRAPESIKAAAQLYMQPIYELLEQYRTKANYEGQ